MVKSNHKPEEPLSIYLGKHAFQPQNFILGVIRTFVQAALSCFHIDLPKSTKNEKKIWTKTDLLISIYKEESNENMKSLCENLAAEPSSLSASASNLLNTAFFSSFVALKNSFTKLSRASTVPAQEDKRQIASETSTIEEKLD